MLGGGCNVGQIGLTQILISVVTFISAYIRFFGVIDISRSDSDKFQLRLVFPFFLFFFFSYFLDVEVA